MRADLGLERLDRPEQPLAKTLQKSANDLGSLVYLKVPYLP